MRNSAAPETSTTTLSAVFMWDRSWPCRGVSRVLAPLIGPGISPSTLLHSPAWQGPWPSVKIEQQSTSIAPPGAVYPGRGAVPPGVGATLVRGCVDVARYAMYVVTAYTGTGYNGTAYIVQTSTKGRPRGTAPGETEEP